MLKYNTHTTIFLVRQKKIQRVLIKAASVIAYYILHPNMCTIVQLWNKL